MNNFNAQHIAKCKNIDILLKIQEKMKIIRQEVVKFVDTS